MTWSFAGRLLLAQWKYQSRLRWLLTVSIGLAVALAGSLSLASSALFRLAAEEAPYPVIVLESGSGFTDGDLNQVRDLAGEEAIISQFSEFDFHQVDGDLVRQYTIVALQGDARGIGWDYPPQFHFGEGLETTEQEPEVVLGRTLWEELFPTANPGTLIQLETINDFPTGGDTLEHFRVVGVTKETLRVAFILHTRVAAVSGGDQTPTSLSISYDTPFISFVGLRQDLAEIVPDAAMEDNGDQVSRSVGSTTGEDPVILRDWAVGVGLFIWILVPALVGSVGWQLVASRRSQWAIFMAVGHPSTRVRRLLFIEVLTLGLLGLALGWLIAATTVGLIMGSWPIRGFVGYYLATTFIIPVLPATWVAWRYPLPRDQLAQVLGGGL